MDHVAAEAQKTASFTERMSWGKLTTPWNLLRTHGAFLIVFFILILLSITSFSWYFTNQYVNRQARAKFDKAVEETKFLIKDRMEVYVNVLYGLQALFAASRLVERDEWAAYTQTQNLAVRYPGIAALAFLERVPHAGKDAFIKDVRSDISVSPAGYPDFKIYPEGDREEYYVVKYVEPHAGSEAALGFDVGSESMRLLALKEAMDAGRPIATKRVSLVIDPRKRPGFLVFLPIYRKEVPLSSVEERRAAVGGFVAAAFQAEDLLSGVFGKKSVHPEIGFQVFDGESANREHLLYDDESAFRALYPNFRPRFAARDTLNIAGRVWTLKFDALPEFGLTQTEERLPLIVLFGGTIFSLLLFGILYAFVTSRSQAVLIAEGMTTKLRESQREYADLVEGAPDPIITLDRLGYLRSMNPAAEYVSGYRAREIVGKYFASVGALTTSALRKTLQEFALVIVGKERPPFELEIIKRDGSVLTMEANPRPIKQEGKTVAVQVIFRDVTERKRIEKVLEASRNYLDKIINTVADPIFVKDRRHRWVMANDAYCHFMGYKREEIVGKSDYDFFPKEEADVFAEKDEFVFETGKENLNEEKFTDAHGVTHIVRTRKSLYTDAKGEQFIVGVIRDFTGQKLAEEKIKELNEDLRRRNLELININKELEAFSYSVSHDLRAPLRAISGFSNALLEDCLARLDAEGQRYLNLISDNAHNMGQLIDDLLTFSRLGRKEIQLSNVDMGELAREVFKELKMMEPERNIQLNIQPLYPARCDQPMIRQVLVNLISNAIKFTSKKEEAVIEINSREEGNETIYTIKDNGVGFDMKYAGKLFGVFQRLHTAEEFEGTGVGLAIVQRIIHRHGGRVGAEGKVDEGAAFYFSLPITMEGGKI